MNKLKVFYIEDTITEKKVRGLTRFIIEPKYKNNCTMYTSSKDKIDKLRIIYDLKLCDFITKINPNDIEFSKLGYSREYKYVLFEYVNGKFYCTPVYHFRGEKANDSLYTKVDNPVLEEDDKCPICLIDFDNESIISEIKCCKQKFCQACLDDYINKEWVKCPCCRELFSSLNGFKNYIKWEEIEFGTI